MITLYLAESEPTYLEALERILASIRGIRVVGHTTNGVEALDQVQLLRPDVVLLNVIMPDLNGLEIVRSIRRESISSIIVTLSDQASSYFKEAAIEAGADFHLDKLLESRKIGPILQFLAALLSVMKEQAVC
jgi:DNA-binding NarL/FixJ family response regulator